MSESSERPAPKLTTEDSIDDQIAFVLGNPRMSAWLQVALREALLLDPIDVLGELEILNHILRQRSELLLARTTVRLPPEPRGEAE